MLEFLLINCVAENGVKRKGIGKGPGMPNEGRNAGVGMRLVVLDAKLKAAWLILLARYALAGAQLTIMLRCMWHSCFRDFARLFWNHTYNVNDNDLNIGCAALIRRLSYS